MPSMGLVLQLRVMPAQRVLTAKDWEAYCTAEDSPLVVLHEDSPPSPASDVMTKVWPTSAMRRLMHSAIRADLPPLAAVASTSRTLRRSAAHALHAVSAKLRQFELQAAESLTAPLKDRVRHL